MGKIIDKTSLIKEIDACLKKDLIPDHVAGYRFFLEGVYCAIIEPSITTQQMYKTIAATYNVDEERVRQTVTSLFQSANRIRKKEDLPSISMRKYIMQLANQYYELERFMIEVPNDNA